jgi:hypothetical protein
MEAIGAARSRVRRATHDRNVAWLARAGLAARGVIYLVIGVLAIKLAVGDGGKTTDQQGALKTIAQQPFGQVLLVLVAVGVAGYALWRFSVAASSSEDAKQRLDGLIGGLGYGALCFTAIKLLAGAGTGGGHQEDKATGGVLAWPGGTWIIGIAGLVFIGVALDQGYKGVRRKFCEEARTHEMSRGTRRAYEGVGMFGHLARMVIFGLIGVFLIKAAIEYDPHNAVALDGALAKVAHAPAGPFLLGAVAVGLIGFAIYSFMDARYHEGAART